MELISFLPQPELALIYRDRLVRESIKTLMSVLEKEQIQQRAQTYRIIDSLYAPMEDQEIRLYHPLYFTWYFRLIDAYKRGQTDHIQSLIDAFPLLEHSIERSHNARYLDDCRLFDVPEIRPDLDHGTRNGETETVIRFGTGSFAFTHGLTAKKRTVLQQALQLIEAVTPEFIKEMRALIKMLVPFECAGNTINFSDIRSQGAIFLGTGGTTKRDSFESPVYLAGQIVHEAAHNFLTCVAVSLPMFEDAPDRRFMTALRPDPRPINGAFHQMFVLARMKYLFDSLAAQGTDCSRELLRVDKAFPFAIKVIEDNAKLTMAGRCLVDSIHRHFAGKMLSHEQSASL